MHDTTKAHELSYKSTRETAKILQVSLGTVQKMVETGELIAWKTRGGHRRILDLSIERLLSKRHELLRHFCSKKFSVLGMFLNADNLRDFENHCSEIESRIECHLFTDISEALMSAVSLQPEIIFVDQHINAIDQYHCIHQLNKNMATLTIPILIHQDTLGNPYQVNPGDNPERTFKEMLSPTLHGKIYQYTNAVESIENVIKKALVEKVL